MFSVSVLVIALLPITVNACNSGLSANFGLNVSANGTSIGAGVSFSVSNGYELSYSSVSTYLS